MGIFRMIGMMSIVPTTILLTVSFFVLFAAGKADGKGLKNFGLVVAILLWICAALVLSSGFYMASSGKHLLTSRMSYLMNCGMQPQMMQKHMMYPMMKKPMMMHKKMMGK